MSGSETAALDAAAGMHDAVARLRQLLAAALEADARAFGKAARGTGPSKAGFPCARPICADAGARQGDVGR